MERVRPGIRVGARPHADTASRPKRGTNTTHSVHSTDSPLAAQFESIRVI
jgi:hypothetical protein